MKLFIAMLTIIAGIGAGLVYADAGVQRTVFSFFDGHTHDDRKTVGAPSHSGGLDRYGCHNKSVPYHCHR